MEKLKEKKWTKSCHVWFTRTSNIVGLKSWFLREAIVAPAAKHLYFSSSQFSDTKLYLCKEKLFYQ